MPYVFPNGTQISMQAGRVELAAGTLVHSVLRLGGVLVELVKRPPEAKSESRNAKLKTQRGFKSGMSRIA